VYKPQRALTQPRDLSIDLDETLFGFGRELGAGLDGRMERAAALDRFAPVTESAAVLKLSLDAGSFSRPGHLPPRSNRR